MYAARQAARAARLARRPRGQDAPLRQQARYSGLDLVFMEGSATPRNATQRDGGACVCLMMAWGRGAEPCLALLCGVVWLSPLQASNTVGGSGRVRLSFQPPGLWWPLSAAMIGCNLDTLHLHYLVSGSQSRNFFLEKMKIFLPISTESLGC